jgi:hypothetical protein
VQHLRITGAAYRPLADASPTVELAVATRRGETSPAVRQVLAVARAVLRAPEEDV